MAVPEAKPVPGCIAIPLRNRRGEIVAHTLISEQDAHLAEFRWYRKPDGYAARWVRLTPRLREPGYQPGLKKGRLVLLHRLIMNAPRGVEIDHINRNRLDNRRENLRFATDAENVRNAKLSKKNSTGFKGVYFCQVTIRWVAAIRVNGRNYHLGSYDSAEKAALAYDFAAIDLHGEFASLNFNDSRQVRTSFEQNPTEVAPTGNTPPAVTQRLTGLSAVLPPA